MTGGSAGSTAGALPRLRGAALRDDAFFGGLRDGFFAGRLGLR